MVGRLRVSLWEGESYFQPYFITNLCNSKNDFGDNELLTLSDTIKVLSDLKAIGLRFPE